MGYLSSRIMMLEQIWKQVHNLFGGIFTFLMIPTNKLHAIMDDQKLAVTIDDTAPFVKAHYKLEEDGLLALYTYCRLSSLYDWHIT